MFLRFNSFQKRIDARIFMFFLITVIIIIGVLSAILYINFENIMLDKIYRSELDVLSQISFSLNYLKLSSLNICMQIYSNPDIASLLFYKDIDERTILDSLNRLSIYRYGTTFINSIYIYNSNSGEIYVDSNNASDSVFYTDVFYDREIIKIIRDYKKYGWFIPIPRTIPIYLNDKNTDRVYSYIYYNDSVDNNRLNNAIILNISASWLNDLIKSLNTDPTKDTFIIDENGIVFSSSDEGNFLKDISGSDYIKQILNTQENSGFLLPEVDNKKYFVSFLRHNLYKLIFVRAIPYNELIAGLNKMKLNTLIFCFGILILGLAVSLFFLKYVKKLVNVVIEKLETVEKKRKTEIQLLKSNYLKDIITGHTYYDFGEFNNTKDEFDIELDFKQSMAAVLFLIDGYYKLYARFNNEDMQNIRSNIKSIIRKAFNFRYSSEIIDMGEESLFFIFNFEQSFDETDITQIITEVQSTILKNADISISAIITEYACGMEEVNRLYESAMAVSNNKIFTGHGSILKTADYIKPETDAINRDPDMKEIKYLVENLLKGSLEKVYAHYRDILDKAKKEQYEAFYMIMTRLAFEIHVAINLIKKNFKIYFPFNLNLFLKKLQQTDTIDEINEMYINLFRDIAARLEEQKSSKHDEIAENTIKIIKERYNDINLSVESIAREINMSAAYLGQIFRIATTKSIPSFINEIRIEKACQFLLKTNYQMDKIAEMVGYTNTIYFHKIFKKFHDITPLKYREKNK